MLEEQENPFLADFYADRPGAALQAQLFYLLNRHRQQTTLRQADLFSQTMVCDYVFDKDKIFAYLNLDDNELFIYQRLFDLLSKDVPPPDLVLYLQAPTDVLLRRLRLRRERILEDAPDAAHLEPDPEYLRELNEAYHHFFFHYDGDAPSGRRNVGVRLDGERRGARRSDQADRRDGRRHAVLRATHEVSAKLPRDGVVQEDAQAHCPGEGQGQPGAGRPVGQVSGLRAGHLQQGSRRPI